MACCAVFYSDGATSREALLAEALADAEAAIAELQAKLVGSLQQQQLTAARLEEVQQRSMTAAVRHGQALATAKKAGAAQLAALQEAVGRLGHRGELAGQVCLVAMYLVWYHQGGRATAESETGQDQSPDSARYMHHSVSLSGAGCRQLSHSTIFPAERSAAL